MRSLDLPWWINLPVGPDLHAKAGRPGSIGVGAAASGCADASLYRRFRAAGLTQLTLFPQLATIDPTIEPFRADAMEQHMLANLTAAEKAEWQQAVAAAKADSTFFIASPFHCAVGTKPA